MRFLPLPLWAEIVLYNISGLKLSAPLLQIGAQRVMERVLQLVVILFGERFKGPGI